MERVLAAIVTVAVLLWPSYAADIAATPAMWVAHGPQGTVYLLGSMHRLPKGVHWQTPAITAAMKRADAFVFEVPLDTDSREEAAITLRHKGVFSVTTALPSYFDDETREDFRRVIMRTHIDPALVVHLRPWLAALYLQGAAQGPGEETVAGVDDQIYAWAKKHKIRKFGALETAEQQFDAVKGGQQFQDEMVLFRLMLKSILTTKQPPAGKLFEAWAKGDTKTLAAFGPDDASMPVQLRKPLLEDRNRRWVPQIEAMLKSPRTTFITVGAAHLVGKVGVTNLLRAKGYTVDDPAAPCCADTPALRLSMAH